MFGVFYFGEAYFADGTAVVPTPPVAVTSDNAALSIDLPEMGAVAPGTMVLGGAGQGGMT